MLDCRTSTSFFAEGRRRDKSKGFGEGVDLEREDQVHGELDGLPGAVRAR